MVKFKPNVKKKRALVAIASGGTGGHVFPASFVANIINKKHDVLFITDIRGEKYSAYDGNNVLVLNAFGLSGSLYRKAIALFYLMLNVLMMFIRFVKSRPAVLVSFGGYTAAASAIAAILLRIPIVIHEQNSIMGQVHSFIAPFAAKITVAYASDLIPYEYEVVGMPIRGDFVVAARTYKTKHDIFILGGSQGSRLLAGVIAEGISLLPESFIQRVNVFHQCQADLVDKVSGIYAEKGVNAAVKQFFHNTNELFSKADLVISRAGALTISEIHFFNKPAILIPMKLSKGNHQLYNARAFLKFANGCLIQEDDLNKYSLRDAIADILIAGKASEMLDKQDRGKFHAGAAPRLAMVINKFIIEEN